MTTKSAARTFQALQRRSRPICECTSPPFSRLVSNRQLSSSPCRRDVQYDTESGRRPRWAHTPEKMKSSLPYRQKDPAKQWTSNSDPAVLDRFYEKFLGPGGHKLLTEEVKWQAITHKSFDQGRRGFNDRLAFFGRRIVNLQTTLALLHSPIATKTQSAPDPLDDREPFQHPALTGLQNLSDAPLGEILSKTRLGQLGNQIGMREIIRWEPRLKDRLDTSGIDVVLATSLYAIIGAIALQRGGEVAAQITRDKILKPLGIS